MSATTQTIEAVIEAVSEFAILDHLLTTRSTATALERYLEFQAYVELVHLASAEDTLPSNHGLKTIPISEIENWIKSGNNIRESFQEKIRDLLRHMQEAGSKGFNDICKFYCDYKSKLDAGFTTASLVLSNADLASLVTQYKLDALIFHGVPLTTFLVLAIKWGILDEFCDCENC